MCSVSLLEPSRGAEHVFSVLCYGSVIMSGLQCLAQEKIWFDKSRYDEAERCFYEGINGVPSAPQVPHHTHATLRVSDRLFGRYLFSAVEEGSTPPSSEAL